MVENELTIYKKDSKSAHLILIFYRFKKNRSWYKIEGKTKSLIA